MVTKAIMAHGSRYRRKRAWRSLNRTVNQSPESSPPQRVIIRYVSTSVQTDNEMTEVKKKSMPDLESVNRITNFPIVESSLNYAEDVYNKIKKSNSVFNFALEQAENTIHTVVDTAAPALVLLQGPINSVDKLVCKSLDFVEDKIPSINLPPQMIYWNTKQYAKDTVSTRIVRPVLQRADSAKQLANTVLSSKYTAYAADTLDGALNVADKYVDKYLPDDEQNIEEVTNDTTVDGPAGKAYHTIHHADRLGRKLKRRLTRRTLAEVKALKEHSAEAVHVLIYVAELVATDPKLAFQKGKELWASLSQDEPENQARPENLEQLVVLLTRETSRRIVHFINYSSALVSKVPKRVSHSALTLVNKFFGNIEHMIKTVHMENAQQSLVKTVKSRAHGATILMKQLNIRLTNLLEQLAQKLDEQEQPKTVLSVPRLKVQQLKAFHTNSVPNRNGFETNSTNST